MGRITLEIEDLGNRMLLRAMLQAAGHALVEAEPEVVLTDNPARARALVELAPVLLITPVSGVAEAVRAMEQGVFGYVLTPLLPGEAQVMVRRALERRQGAQLPAEDLKPLAEVEREHVLRVLRACRHNHSEAARVLGIGRNTLWRKLRSYEVLS